MCVKNQWRDWKFCLPTPAENIRAVARTTSFVKLCVLLHCALASGVVYCNRSCLCVCVFVTGGRAGGRCPNLTTASARAVFASLWALFSLLLRFCHFAATKGPLFSPPLCGVRGGCRFAPVQKSDDRTRFCPLLPVADRRNQGRVPGKLAPAEAALQWRRSVVKWEM